jgi:integrase
MAREKTRIPNVFKLSTRCKSTGREITRFETNVTRKLPDGRIINYQRRHDTQRAAELDRDRVISEIRAGVFRSPTDRKAAVAAVRAAAKAECLQQAAIPTVAQALEDYLQWLLLTKSVPPGKREQDRIRFVAQQAVGALRVTELDDAAADGFIRQRLADGVKQNTVRKELAILKRWRVLAHKAALGSLLPPGKLQPDTELAVGDARTRRPEKDEFEQIVALLEASGGRIGQWTARAACLARETGMRQGELCTARWADVDWKVHVLNLGSAQTKGRVQRAVPLSGRALSVLNQLPRENELILGGLRADRCSAAWARACKRLGIVDLRFHDLRADAISRLATVGLSVPELQVCSGHKTLAMLTRYLRFDSASVAAKLQ